MGARVLSTRTVSVGSSDHRGAAARRSLYNYIWGFSKAYVISTLPRCLMNIRLIMSVDACRMSYCTPTVSRVPVATLRATEPSVARNRMYAVSEFPVNI